MKDWHIYLKSQIPLDLPASCVSRSGHSQRCSLEQGEKEAHISDLVLDLRPRHTLESNGIGIILNSTFFFLKSRHLEQSRGSLRLSFHSYEPIYNHS